MKQQQTARTVPFVPVNPCSSHKLSPAEFKARSSLATKQQLAMCATYIVFALANAYRDTFSHLHLDVVLHRLEASDEFQAWRHSQPHTFWNSKPAQLIMLTLAATSVLGATWLLHTPPSAPPPEPIWLQPLDPPSLFPNTSLEQQPAMPTACPVPHTLAPPLTTAQIGLLDAARQALLLMVAVVGASAAVNLFTRLLHKPPPTPTPTPTLDYKPEPLYGQLLILQAELAKKARELQATSTKCMELDAAAAVLREENKDLQAAADRHLEAKVQQHLVYIPFVVVFVVVVVIG